MKVIQCIVVQWRHISSESAVKSVFSFPSNCVNIWQQNVSKLLPMCSISIKYDAQLMAWDILLVLTSVAENLCNKCPKRLFKQNSSYSDSFRRPCDSNKRPKENITGRPPLDAAPPCRPQMQIPLVMWPVMHAGKPTPICEQNDTGVKTLRCPKLRLRVVMTTVLFHFKLKFKKFRTMKLRSDNKQLIMFVMFLCKECSLSQMFFISGFFGLSCVIVTDRKLE